MIEKLIARLVGDGSSFSSMMDTATLKTGKFEKTIAGANRKVEGIGRSATNLGRKISLGVTLPLIGVGGLATREFAKFDQAMTKSTSIMTLFPGEAEKMRVAAISLSGEAIQGPTQLAESYFFLASAGFDAEQSIAALPQVAKFATAGAFDMAVATDLLTDAQSALGLTSKDAQENLIGMTKVSDVLVKANTLANASVEQFSQALTNTAGATLKNFNKSIEEGVAVLAAYADQGVKAQVAGTNLTRVTLLLQKSAQSNAKAHEELGFNVFDAQGKMNNYANIIKQLEKITEGMSDETKAATLAQLGFTARVQNAILPLIGMSEKIEEYQEKLESAGGATQQVADNQMKSFTNQMTLLKNQTIGLLIALGDALAPAILEVNRLIRAAVSRFQNLDTRTQGLVAAAVALTSALGPVLLVLGPIISSFATLIPIVSGAITAVLAFINPVVAVIAILAGIVAAVRLVAGSWERAEQIITGAIDAAVDHLIFMQRIITRSVISLGGWLAGRFMDIFTVDFVNSVVAGIRIVTAKLGEFVAWGIRKLRSLFTGEETGTVQDFLDQIGGDLQRGAQNKNFLDTLAQITQEELGALELRRAGKTILPEDNRQVIQTKIVEAKDQSSKAIEKIREESTKQVDLLKELVEKQGLELAPLGL